MKKIKNYFAALLACFGLLAIVCETTDGGLCLGALLVGLLCLAIASKIIDKE